MKKLSILLMFCALVVVAQAQKPKKPSIAKVKSYIAKEQWAEAVEMIELVVNDEKLKTKPDAWTQRINVYKAVYEGGTVVGGVSTDAALANAVESLAKLQEVEGKGETGTYYILAKTTMDGLYNGILNEGVKNYEAGSYEAAIVEFEKLSKVNPDDTIGSTYAAQVANEIEDWPTLVTNYKRLGGMLKRENFYATVIQIQKDVMEDYPAAMATVKEAQETLEESQLNNINKYEIDLLIATDKIEDAKNKLVTAIESEPDVPILRLRLALLYDQLSANERKLDEPNKEKLDEYEAEAGKAYEKTLELDPTNLTALYNYSVVFNERANAIIKELENKYGSDFKAYQKNQQDYNDRAMALIKQGLPYMERALGAAPEDQDVLFALEIYYSRLKMNDKLQEIQNKMKELGYID